MNGIEKLWYCQNSQGRVFLTSPESPIPPGYLRHSTTIPSEMDKVFAKLNTQTREEYSRMTENDFHRRKSRIDQWRSDIRSRMASADCSDVEKAILKAALVSCDKREDKLNSNTVYGVSAMQTTESNPKAPGDNRVHFDTAKAPKVTVN